MMMMMMCLPTQAVCLYAGPLGEILCVYLAEGTIMFCILSVFLLSCLVSLMILLCFLSSIAPSFPVQFFCSFSLMLIFLLPHYLLFISFILEIFLADTFTCPILGSLWYLWVSKPE